MSDVNDPKQWLRVAEDDLIAIHSILKGKKVPWRVVCYLAQQVGEKLLKGFLAANDQPNRKIHDLGALLTECRNFDPGIEALRSDCDGLTPYWVGTRYPGDVAFVATASDGRACVAAAERIRLHLLPLLSK